MVTVDKELAEIDTSTHDHHEIESAVLSFDPIWEAMTLRDRIRLIEMVVKRVDYDGETGRVTITFHPLGGPRHLLRRPHVQRARPRLLRDRHAWACDESKGNTDYEPAVACSRPSGAVAKPTQDSERAGRSMP